TDGYAPIAAYLGREGWCLELELREGKQHSQENFIPFLSRVLHSARRLTQDPVLVRLDSAHDALDTRAELAGHAGVDYVLKWNPRRQDEAAWLSRAAKEGRELPAREGKRVWLWSETVPQQKDGKHFTFRRVVRVTERKIDKHGQCLLSPEIALEGWWTSLSSDAVSDEQVIELYQGHGTSEQFHSEFKTDLDIERLPSGKFATNALVLSMAAFAYNILRFIGQLGLLGERTPVRHAAKRRRIKTVIQELIYLAARMIDSGRRLRLRFSRHCPAFDAFKKVYGTLFAKPAYG
ncbi:MAG: IS1380 family transposase, partial [Thermoleophilia bacterium]